MGRRGRKRRLELEGEYWRLLSAGIGTVEACREAGIGRKTGFRWRQENGGLPPSRIGEADGSGRYLSRFERQRIAALAERGHGVCEIARRLGRAPSTVSRELRRNKAPHDRGGYDGDLAHARARERAERPKVARLAADVELRQVVTDKLGLEWSPEQIASHLRAEYPDRPGWHVCAETIYQALYLPARGALTRNLTLKLRTGRPMRKRRRRPDRRRVRFSVPGASIATRPAKVQTRAVPGNWEGDLIVGRSNRSAIGTLVERCSSYTRLAHLPDGHDADELHDALTSVLLTLPDELRVTLTWDQWRDGASCRDRRAARWRGVLRRPRQPLATRHERKHQRTPPPVFPQRQRLSLYSPANLHAVEERLNNRPRKILSWSTPAAVLRPHI